MQLHAVRGGEKVERKGAVKNDGRDSRFLCHCAAESGSPLLLDEKNGCMATYAASTSLFLSVIWNEKRRFPPFLFRCTPHPNGGLISLPSLLPSFLPSSNPLLLSPIPCMRIPSLQVRGSRTPVQRRQFLLPCTPVNGRELFSSVRLF